MLSLVVRFDLWPGSEEAFDQLARETMEGVVGEEGTMIYVCHSVEHDEHARVLYEVYRDRAALCAGSWPSVAST